MKMIFIEQGIKKTVICFNTPFAPEHVYTPALVYLCVRDLHAYTLARIVRVHRTGARGFALTRPQA